MQAGKLKRRIVFEQIDPVDPEYFTFAQRWASVEALDSDTFTIKLRYLEGIDQNKHRIIYQGNVLEIRSMVDKGENHKELEIMAVAPQPNGVLRG